LGAALLSAGGWAAYESFSPPPDFSGQTADARYMAIFMNTSGRMSALTNDLQVLVRQRSEIPQLARRPEWLKQLRSDVNEMENFDIIYRQVLPPSQYQKLHTAALDSLDAQLLVAHELDKAIRDGRLSELPQITRRFEAAQALSDLATKELQNAKRLKR
jgi:hypothetical protein